MGWILDWLPTDDRLLNLTTEALGVFVSVPISVWVGIQIERGFQKRRARTRVQFIVPRSELNILLTVNPEYDVNAKGELEDVDFGSTEVEVEAAYADFLNNLFRSNRRSKSVREYFDEHYTSQFHDYDKGSERIIERLSTASKKCFWMISLLRGSLTDKALGDKLDAETMKNAERLVSEILSLIKPYTELITDHKDKNMWLESVELKWRQYIRLTAFFIDRIPKPERKEIYEDLYWKDQGTRRPRLSNTSE